jgi:hypothetical protein
VAFWNRKEPPPPVIPAAEIVKVVHEEPYIPQPRTVAVADWTVTYSDGSTITITATHMWDSRSYVYLGQGGGWHFSDDSKEVVWEIKFCDTVWGESATYGKSTERLVARVTTANLRSVTSQNWREESRGIW